MFDGLELSGFRKTWYSGLVNPNVLIHSGSHSSISRSSSTSCSARSSNCGRNSSMKKYFQSAATVVAHCSNSTCAPRSHFLSCYEAAACFRPAPRSVVSSRKQSIYVNLRPVTTALSIFAAWWTKSNEKWHVQSKNQP